MGKAHWVLAAAVYLCAALFAFRVVLPDPFTRLPYSAHMRGTNLAVDQTDQQFVVASLARTARSTLRAPDALWDNLQCHPMFRPVTLGEHMLGEGLLGAWPALLTDDPVFTYNAVLVSGLWIAGLSMYALVLYWTGSPRAALVAGLLFATQPGRIGDPTHPFVHGDLWSPLVLLATHVLFVRGTWAAAAALAAALALALLESLYAIFALALVAAVYVPYLLIRFRAGLRRLLPKLAFVVAVGAGIGVAVFAPYLHTRDVWGILEGRGALLFPIEQFLPGTFYYPGTVVLVLAALAILDRLRRARPGAERYDPRLVFLAAAAFVLWTVVWGIPIPGTGLVVPSPYTWAHAWLPGLGAIRAVPAARTGMYLCLTFLAGYGARLAIGSLPGWSRPLATGALLAAAALETFHPEVSRVSLGISPVAMKVRRLAPSPALRALVQALPDGAVLDVPFRLDPLSRFATMAHFVFLGAYHQRPVAACYNSFTVPIMDQMAALASRLPEPGALAALHALGYRSIVTHDEFLPPPARAALRATLAAPAAGPLRLLESGAVDGHRTFLIDGTQTVTTDPRALSGAEPWVAPDVVSAAGTTPIPFRVRNRSTETFRTAEPVEPSELVVTWRPLPAGRAVTEAARALLPMALAAGEERTQGIALRVPAAPGRYEVSVAFAAAPDVSIARSVVEVGT
jgi:hypothetical protein